jgi:hypothetical protein
MNTRSLLTRTIVVFTALAAAGIILALSARFLTGILEQTVFIALGSAMFGAALSFFLVRSFALLEK